MTGGLLDRVCDALRVADTDRARACRAIDDVCAAEATRLRRIAKACSEAAEELPDGFAGAAEYLRGKAAGLCDAADRLSDDDIPF